MTEKSRSELAAELAAAEARLALARAGGDPDAVSSRWPAEPPVSTVLRFNHAFSVAGSTGDAGYTYLALNTGAGAQPWYVTGARGRNRHNWASLCEFIGDSAECLIATSWVEVPALEHPPTEPGDVAAYVAEHFSETAV